MLHPQIRNWVALWCLLFPLFLFAQSQDTLTLCNVSSPTVSTAHRGVVYDSGGPNGNYYDNENCTALIVPEGTCSSGFTLFVDYFSSESCCDHLLIHDGEDANAPIVAQVYGILSQFSLPITSGKVFLSWHTDGSVVASGFQLRWESGFANSVPVPSILASDLNPAFHEPVSFTSVSSEYASTWYWDFGDGTVSFDQSPTHLYSQAGTYTVRLAATNCLGTSDTVEQVVTVHPPPTIEVVPASLSLQASCGDTATAQLTLNNTGQGELVYAIEEALALRPQVAVHVPNTDLNSTNHIIGTLEGSLDSGTVQSSFALDAAGLRQELARANVLVFPQMLSSFEIWSYMNLSEEVGRFLGRGGCIVVCGAFNYDVMVNFLHLFDGFSPYPNSFDGQILTPNLQHPITQTLPEFWQAPYGTYGYSLSNNSTYQSLSSDANGYSPIGYQPVGQGMVVYLGYNYLSASPEFDQALTQAVQWGIEGQSVLCTPVSGSVAPGQSQTIEVRIPTNFVQSGTYSGSISIAANTQDATALQVPITLDVQGQAILAVSSDTVDFYQPMQFTTSVLPLTLYNTGCDTLWVQSAIFSDPAFFLDSTHFFVLPYSEWTVNIHFEPQDTGHYQAQLKWVTNGGTTTVDLLANVLGAPVLALSQDTLTVTTDCGNIIETDLVLYNTGLGELQVAQQLLPDSSQLRVTILDLFSYNTIYGSVISNSITEAYDNPLIQHVYWAVDTLTFRAMLNSSDVVVIPSFYYYSSYQYYWEQVLPMLNEYCNKGGRMLLTGSPYVHLMDLVGVQPNGGFSYDFTNDYQFLPEDPNHPLLLSVNTSTYTGAGLFGTDFQDGDFTPLMTKYGYDAAGYLDKGNYKMVYIGYSAYYDDIVIGNFVKNAVQWLHRPNAFNITFDQNAIAVGDSAVLHVGINTNGFANGTYTATLALTTNQPNANTVLVPVVLQVQGTPQLSTPQNGHSFSLVSQYATEQHVLPLENTGCDTLHLSQWTFDNPDFTVVQIDTILLPFERGNLTVQWHSNNTGLMLANLHLVSDGGNAVLPFSAIAVNAPLTAVQPALVQESISCITGSEQKTLTIQNIGTSGLQYRAGQWPVAPTVTILAAGAEVASVDNLYGWLAPKGTVKKVGIVDAQLLADSLAISQLLVLPRLSSAFANGYADLKPVIAAFLARGGNIFISGGTSASTLSQLGLVPASTQLSEVVYPVVESSPHGYTLFKNLAPSLPVQWFDGGQYAAYFPSGSGFTPLLDIQGGGTYSAVKSQGNGYIVWWGSTYIGGDLLYNEVLNSLLDWIENPLPLGVVPPATDAVTINAGSSNTLSLLLEPSGVPAGTYIGQLRLYSNDPVQNPYVVPVELVIEDTPCAAFEVVNIDCNGNVLFKNASANTTTAAYWNFGDGIIVEDMFQIQHEYDAVGDYTVSLIVCNGILCDTATQVISILELGGPTASSCVPGVNSVGCCNVGPVRVQLGTLDHESTDGASGEPYSDYSCFVGTDLVVGEQYSITVTTSSSYYQYVKAWVDFNDDGQFTLNEMVLSSNGYTSHSGFVTAPSNATKDKPLRLRVMADTDNFASDCQTLYTGQTEDYYVVFRVPSGVTAPSTDGAGLVATVSPNPATQGAQLVLNAPLPEGAQVWVYNASGQVVETLSADHRAALHLRQQPPGTYLVQVRSGAQLLRLRWVCL